MFPSMHLPAFLLPVFVCLPAAVCLSVCLVSTFNFPASLPVLWQPACLMAACLSHDSLLVSWQPACLITAYLSYGSLPVLWQPACPMTACLSYDCLPVLWLPACHYAACLSCILFLCLSSSCYLPVYMLDASLPYDSSQPASLLTALLEPE